MKPAAMRTAPPAAGSASGRTGRLAVVAMVGIGLALALFGILHQRSQTVLCLRFLGASTAREITGAKHVELLRLRPTDREGRLVAEGRWDISAARGLVHLRRGLVEDANYAWSDDERMGPLPDDPGTAAGKERLPGEAWAWGIAFADSPRAVEGGHAKILVFAPADAVRGVPGWVALVGKAGRVRLGRIERGLLKWIDDFPAARRSDANR